MRRLIVALLALTLAGCATAQKLGAANDVHALLIAIRDNDRTAFDAHLKSPHFAVFNRESEALVISKTVVQYNLACEGSQAS